MLPPTELADQSINQNPRKSPNHPTLCKLHKDRAPEHPQCNLLNALESTVIATERIRLGDVAAALDDLGEVKASLSTAGTLYRTLVTELTGDLEQTCPCALKHLLVTRATLAVFGRSCREGEQAEAQDGERELHGCGER